MYHKLLVRVAILVMFVFSISACYPWIKRIEVSQGNIVETEQLAKLTPGISREQVRFILGTPIVTNPFSDQTWHYYYFHRDTDDVQVQYTINVYFDGDNYVDHQIIGTFVDIKQAEGIVK